MIATRRMAIHDYLLVACSTTMVVLAIWPAPVPRQTILLRDASGHLQRYCLETTDPRLAKLRRAAAQSDLGPDRQLAVTKWRAELAEFYAGKTAADPHSQDTVARVSFTDRDPPVITSDKPPEAQAIRAEHEYWVQAADRARNQITAIEQRLARRASIATPPSISLGEIRSGTHPPITMAIAAAIGIAVAMMFGFWTLAAPAIGLQGESGTRPGAASSRPSDRSLRELQLVIPARWVRVHQPWSVNARRSAYGLLVLAGLACAIC